MISLRALKHKPSLSVGAIRMVDTVNAKVKQIKRAVMDKMILFGSDGRI